MKHSLRKRPASDLYDFTRRFENVEKKVIDSALAAVRFDFPVEWGEYRVDVFGPATKLTMRYPFRAGWSWNDDNRGLDRSEEHTSELQSLMRISYPVFCLKNKYLHIFFLFSL